MKNNFYSKMAVSNLKNNGKFYIPYIISCVLSIMMLYQIDYIYAVMGKSDLSWASTFKQIIYFGFLVVTIFSVIMLFYTNSFLIKQRKKELGLYNVLGLGKKHISLVMVIESVVVFLITLAGGLFTGVLFSKIIMMVLYKILKFEIPFEFFISTSSILKTIIVFGIIFGLTTIHNISKVQLSKPIELLRGGNVGEKEPKTKWFLTIIGIASLSIGYYIALTTDNPIQAINLFFIAVVLVIVGTYCLFASGSIALLKLLRKNKKYYYKTKNFVSVSNMIYRMKQNAVGLANICILSTMILVMLSTTVSLYFGLEDTLRSSCPRNIEVTLDNLLRENGSLSQATKVNENIKLQNDTVNKYIKDNNIKVDNQISYLQLSANAERLKNNFSVAGGLSATINSITILTLEDYNKLENKNITLNNNEALMHTNTEDFNYDSFKINDIDFNIKKKISKTSIQYNNALDSYIIVLKDKSVMDSIIKNVKNKEHIVCKYYCGFDVSDNVDQEKIQNGLQNELLEQNLPTSADSAQATRQGFLSVYGGLFFLGIFLGVLFISATVLIMYYKQISEGYNDKERFEIMKKVGMEKRQIKKIIHSQILIVFFMPLVTAVIHLAFSFNIIAKLLLCFSMTNTLLFAICTVGTILVFAIFYAIIYMLTAKIYYKIVE